MGDLESWGWDAGWEKVFREGRFAGHPYRVVEEQRGLYRITDGRADYEAEVTGRFRFEAGADPTRYPAVGDFVAAIPETRHRIEAVLPRRTVFERKAAGLRSDHQVAGANVDVAFVVESAERDLSPRRIERYLTLAYDGGASPVLVLNKADRADDPAGLVTEAMDSAPGVPIHLVSALDGMGLSELGVYLQPGVTVVLLGLSGVGKSTLTNALLGMALQATGRVRDEDQRGRQTTTSRTLFRLSEGALLLDTPGMREMGMVEAEEGLGQVFADVEGLALSCRFTDCRHEAEPGCEIRAAVDAGRLPEERLQSWRRLMREMAYQARKENRALWAEERRLWTQRSREGRANRERKMR
ncbi:MAG: ribosome small subunit-dependent GTPase A [Clostridia bacterium]